MGFNRYEAKMAAKNSMRQARPNPLLVTMVYVLLTTGVSLLVTWATGNPINEAVDYLYQGYDWDTVFHYVFIQGAPFVGIYSLSQLVLKLYEYVVDYGYISYSLRLARNEQPGYRNLLDGFARVGQVLWMNILSEIFISLWTLLAAVPVTVVFAVCGITMPNGVFGYGGEEWLVMGIWAVLVATSIVRFVVTYRYRLAVYFLLDDPGCTARQAITRSKAAMRGWKMELFTLDLSFFGWLFLTALTAGVLSIWVGPYIQATYANFYDCVTAGQQPLGGYTGPVYQNDFDYRGKDGPEPF